MSRPHKKMQNEKRYLTYRLTTAAGAVYIGVTSDLPRRLIQHRSRGHSPVSGHSIASVGIIYRGNRRAAEAVERLAIGAARTQDAAYGMKCLNIASGRTSSGTTHPGPSTSARAVTVTWPCGRRRSYTRIIDAASALRVSGSAISAALAGRTAFVRAWDRSVATRVRVKISSVLALAASEAKYE